MIGTNLLHYRIVRLLGEGGMGRVYEAEDTRLKRRVALKVLGERVAGHPDFLERFQREAEALATLNHPNIVTVFAVETDGKVPFLTMELVEGQDLAAEIPSGGMNLDRFFAIALPLAEALSAAHEMGITHRDLKPANILIDRQGRPKVLDFGLAKLTQAAEPVDQTVDMTRPLTEEGRIVGTAPYMSPEQLESRPVDARSDIFSLGIIMYEMLTGKRPFQGESSLAVMSSVLKDSPTRVSDLKMDLPRHLDRIISGCLEKNPEDRPQTAKGVRNSLRSLQKDLATDALLESGNLAAPPATRRPVWRHPLLIGLFVVAVAAGGWYLTGKRDPGQDAPTAEVAAADRDQQRKMIVVLPFENMGASQDEYFADGLTEEITSRLAAIQGLGVISRTSAMQYKGRNVSLQDIGRELGVDFVLEGTVRWQRGETGPSRIRVTPQLIRVQDDTHMWSSRYDRQLEEIFAVQSDIAGEVARQLNINLLEPERRILTSRPTENMEAYKSFLQGKEIWNLPGYDVVNFRRAIDHFKRAVELDPRFLQAWTELSAVYVMLYQGGDGSQETLDLAARALERAESIDPDHPDTLVARAYYWYLGHLAYDRALADFRKAAELAPSNYMVPEGMGYILRRQGHFEEAVAQLERALQLDPGNAHMNLQLARSYAALGKHALADAAYDRSLELYPQGVEAYLDKVDNLFKWKGDPAGALELLDRLPEGGNTRVTLARVNYSVLLRDLERAADNLASLDPGQIGSPFDRLGYFTQQIRLAVLQDDRQTQVAAATAGRALAVTMLDEQATLSTLYALLALFQAVLDMRQEALANLDLAREYGQADRFFRCHSLAVCPDIYLLLGEKDTALDLLEENLDSGCFWGDHRNRLRLDPWWDECREDPRFRRLVASAAG